VRAGSRAPQHAAGLSALLDRWTARLQVLTPVQLCLKTAAGGWTGLTPCVWHGIPRATLPTCCSQATLRAVSRLVGLLLAALVDALVADAGLQATAEGLQDLLDRNALPDVPDYCRVRPGLEAARRLVTYAHKLSYTTFAPLGFVAGQTPLRNFRPPAPQDWQLRASLLHQFAGARALQSCGPAPACPGSGLQHAACLLAVPEVQCTSVAYLPKPHKPYGSHDRNRQSGPGRQAPTVFFVAAATGSLYACKPRRSFLYEWVH